MQNLYRSPGPILQAYDQLLSLGPESAAEIGNGVPIPLIPESSLRERAQSAIPVLQSQPIVLNLGGTWTLIGDVHGNLPDLLHLLCEAKRLLNGILLFLGDMVDRGSFSTEVLTLIASFLVAYPDHVAIIRGNHEFGSICETYGFRDELMSVYHSADLWTQIQQVFGWLPIAAVVNSNCFCVHGGISASYPTIASILAIQKPIFSTGNAPVEDFFCSDPTLVYDLYLPSPRGFGKLYGAKAVAEFLETNHLLQVIRAHEVVRDGVESSLDGLVLTVFSTSDGASPDKNSIGFIRPSDTGEPRSGRKSGTLQAGEAEEVARPEHLDAGRGETLASDGQNRKMSICCSVEPTGRRLRASGTRRGSHSGRF
jgi:diadenosine tetraphosphatase ApaH/serine/threonine PP2A family protein phosphatase